MRRRGQTILVETADSGMLTLYYLRARMPRVAISGYLATGGRFNAIGDFWLVWCATTPRVRRRRASRISLTRAMRSWTIPD